MLTSKIDIVAGRPLGPTRTQQKAWWKEASVYQVYPASFNDSNGDGLGDIPGIVEKLDYLSLLGVDVLWLCPVYASPQMDMGYDISDYYAIDPRYGTMQDIDNLLAGLHQREMKLVMDLVVNHTSDQHAWFKESRSSLDNAKRDWYIWRKPRYDAAGTRLPPNNWASIFGGSAWTFDEGTGEYYLHLFCSEQPDLNWEVPEVVHEVEKVMRFWLDKGIAGFRMDVINLISKTPMLPDAPVSIPGQQYQPAHMHYACGPRLGEHLRRLRTILDEYDAFAVGEMPWAKNEEQVLSAVRAERKELNMIFQFDIVDMDNGPSGKFDRQDWDLAELKRIVEKWQTTMYQNEGWNALFLENHDQARSVSRFASDAPEHRANAAKMLATLLALQSGTLFVYQGQELGLANVPKDWAIEEYKDIETQNMWRQAIKDMQTDEGKKAEYMSQIQLKARDNARMPVQWTAEAYAGFSTVEPWMRVNEDYPIWNAQAQVSDTESVFGYWRKLLRIRKLEADVFVYGSFHLLDREHPDIFCYQRVYGQTKATVVLNFAPKHVEWVVPESLIPLLTHQNLLVHSYSDASSVIEGTLSLRPFEALVWMRDGYKTHL